MSASVATLIACSAFVATARSLYYAAPGPLAVPLVSTVCITFALASSIVVVRYASHRSQMSAATAPSALALASS